MTLHGIYTIAHGKHSSSISQIPTETCTNAEMGLHFVPILHKFSKEALEKCTRLSDAKVPKLIKKSPMLYKTRIFNKDPDVEPT